MYFYFAPMEGITSPIYRKIWRSRFGGADKMFMPFVSPTQNGRFTAKEIREMTAELSEGTNIVPQLMINNAENFIWAAKALRDMGFKEVNLNAGCPSGTVVAKHKGAGMLASPENLEAILARVFDSVSGVRISVKTRLGVSDEKEFVKIIEIYDKFPISELTIHARVRSDFYKEPAHLEAYAAAEKITNLPLCYNGDIFSAADADDFSQKHHKTSAIMLARGIVANPALIREIKTGECLRLDELKIFHDTLLEAYCSALYGDVAVLHKMKELWFYFSRMFESCPELIRAINKSQHVSDYAAAAAHMFAEAEFIGSRKVSFV